MNRRTLAAVIGSGVLSLAGCLPFAGARPTTAPNKIDVSPQVTFYAPTRTPQPTSMTQWQAVSDGVEFIQRLEKAGEFEDWVTLVRIDPSRASIRVHYAPETPRTVREWFGALDASVVINAGFFTPQKLATGLVISDGKRSGQTYKGFGGMFSIRNGKPQLQWLARKPYTNDPTIKQGVQSFPMLLVDGEIVDGLPDDGSRNRRSFIGIDQNGKVVIGVCHSSLWTMTDLATNLLHNPLLNLTDAMNLDGGASSGMWMRGVPEAILADSIDTVPTVITFGD